MKGFSQLLVWDHLSESEREACLQRPSSLAHPQLKSQVSSILYNVKQNKDQACIRYTKLHDRIDISKGYRLNLPQADSIYHLFSQRFIEAYEAAFQNIYAFHQKQLRLQYALSFMDGEITCERHYIPLDAVGLYIPAGTAPLFSSLMMMAIPAKIAGCKRIILCSPGVQEADSNQVTIDPYILHLAAHLGVDEVYALGGAQAIAAMAFGTESITAVHKIFGPGGAWVSEAKRQIHSHDDILCTTDLHAGPSEVMVIADATARADYIAADLLAQAEHGQDSQVVCIFCDNSHHLFSSTKDQIQKQLASLPRKDIIEKSLASARFIAASSLKQALHICQIYAPEHLILSIQEPRSVLKEITRAGSIFLGHHTPESLGDYASGTNHVLPTAGSAAVFGGLGVESFQRSFTVQELHPQNARHLPKHTIELARAEKLEAHAKAMELRLNDFPKMLDHKD